MTFKILYWDSAAKEQRERDSTPEEDAQREADIAASAEIVPQTVTRRKALQALRLAGVTSAMIEGAINAMPVTDLEKELAMIEFQESLEFEYDRPLVIQMAQAFALDRAELFRTAASL